MGIWDDDDDGDKPVPRFRGTSSPKSGTFQREYVPRSPDFGEEKVGWTHLTHEIERERESVFVPGRTESLALR